MGSDHFLAVYGTLRKGFSNHDLLKDSIFIGPGKTVKPYSLFVADYPYAQANPHGSFLIVEVYKISDERLRILDEFEEYRPSGDSLYDRVVTQVRLFTGEEVACFIYVLPHGKAPLKALRIASGDYAESPSQSLDFDES